MDVAVSSSMNIEPPPLLFGPRPPSPHPSHPSMSNQLPPHQSQSQSQPLPQPPSHSQFSSSPPPSSSPELNQNGAHVLDAPSSSVQIDQDSPMSNADGSVDHGPMVGTFADILPDPRTGLFGQGSGEPMDITADGGLHDLSPELQAPSNDSGSGQDEQQSAQDEVMDEDAPTQDGEQRPGHDRAMEPIPTLREADASEDEPTSSSEEADAGLRADDDTNALRQEAEGQPRQRSDSGSITHFPELTAEARSDSQHTGRSAWETPPPTTSESEEQRRQRVHNEQEDTSLPDEEELREIEANPEIYGNDHEYYEKKFFKEPDDPEYIPGDAGKIEWTVTDVKASWNTDGVLVMRSPSVRIGGLDWNIKYYPTGNETDHLSVYIECSRPESPTSSALESSHQDSSVALTSMADAQPSLQNGTSSRSNTVADTGDAPLPPQSMHEDTENPDEIRPDTEESVDAQTESESDNSSTTSSSSSGDEEDKFWSTAAQFGVVLYNPAEPRVHVSHGNHHRFGPTTPDWGWTRFHGPYQQIATRTRGQRQALLRSDTLAFTAYLRVIKDETYSLWDHPRERVKNDSLARTGFRGLSADGCGRSYIIAAMASWCLLAPFQQIINTIPTTDPKQDRTHRPKNLVISLQRVLHKFRTQRKPSSPVILAPLLEVLKQSGINVDSQMDVVEFWGLLRQKLDQELQGTEFQDSLAELFDGLIERPILDDDDDDDDMLTDNRRIPFSAGTSSNFVLPVSGAGTVRNALADSLDHKTYGGNAMIRKMPKLLQLELNRSFFDTSERVWRKNVDKVELDENLDLSPWAADNGTETTYSLYGLIVHSEELKSGLYCPVVRPGGPGSKWISFLDERGQNQAICLTRKQAITMHEGVASGETSKETEQVAYVLMYLRNDVLCDVLRGRYCDSQAPEWIEREAAEFSTGNRREPFQVLFDDLKDGSIHSRIYHSDLFKTHSGPGVIDVYGLPKDEALQDKVFDFTFPWDASVGAAQSRLASVIGNIENPRQCQLWDLSDLHHSRRGSSTRSAPLENNELLSQVRNTGSVRELLLHVLPLAEIPPLPVVPPPNLPPSRAAGFQEASAVPLSPEAESTLDDLFHPVDQEANAASSGHGGLETSAGRDTQANLISPNPDGPVQTTEGDSVVTGQTSADEVRAAPMVQNAWETPDTWEVRMGEAVEDQSEALNEHDGRAAVSTSESDRMPEHTVQSTNRIGASQEPVDAANPDVGFESQPSNADDNHGSPRESRNGSDAPPQPTQDESLGRSRNESVRFVHPPAAETSCLFIKRFDCAKQTLLGVGSYVVKLNDTIGSTIRKVLGLPEEKNMRLWSEARYGSLRQLSSGNTFGQESLYNLAIVIVSDRISNSEKDKILEAGNFADPDLYMEFIINKSNYPDNIDGFSTRHHFSSPRFSGFKKNGRRHGEGSYISSTGDHYEGNFIADYRHGKGTMTYQNKDVYSGDWKWGLMDGEGKMVYHKTGNTYIGGFKDGRRHGRGTMHYVVSEEEQRLCQICYVGEMDCLFYDCGHVCSCLECGRQLETCPVCRKTVINVVKIFTS